MSNLVFPLNLPGLDVKVKRSTVWKTGVQEAHSGKELRASFWSAPRYRYTVSFNFLRQAKNGDEAKTLLDFFDAHKCSHESFLLNDPKDGVQRRVRFDMDEMDLERLMEDTVSGGGRTWEAKTVKLISVK